jgi:uncharacterized protein YerC
VTQVSRRPFEIFISSFISIKNKSRAESFLTEIFSDTERIMIAKRLAIAFLLSKKYSFESIKTMLNVSQNTVCLVNRYIKQEKSGYKSVLKEVAKNENGNSFSYLLAMIDTMLLPPRGSNWKEVRRGQYKRLRDLEKPF